LVEEAKAKTEQESGDYITESWNDAYGEIEENKLSSKDDAHSNKICSINNIKVLHTNVRSLTSGTKREELQVLIKTENIDLFI